jgi:hypothetical protein
VTDIRLYVDEDACETAVVKGLRRRAIDVLTTLEAGRKGADDPKQLAFAVEQGRAIYTFNIRHFAKLHGEWLSQGLEHRGIIVLCDQDLPIGEKVRRLAELISCVTAEEMINRIVYL